MRHRGGSSGPQVAEGGIIAHALYLPLKIILAHQDPNLKNHPVLVDHIETKWNQIKYLYFPLCFVYFIVVLCLSIVTLNIKLHHTTVDTTNQERLTENYFRPGLLISIFCSQLFLIYYKVGIYIRKHYCASKIIKSCRLNIVLLILSFLPIFNFFNSNWPWFILSLNIFAWLTFFSFIEIVPSLGVYILTVKHIAISFIKFSPVVVMLLFPFSVTFHVLLDDNVDKLIENGNTNETNTSETNTNETLKDDSFLALFNTFVRTLVMMIGELDFNESIAKKKSWFTTLIFCFFLFSITIFLMNLLTGVIVADTVNLLQKAEKAQQDLRFNTVAEMEELLPNTWRPFIWRVSKKVQTMMKKCTKFLNYFLNFFIEWPYEEEVSQTPSTQTNFQNRSNSLEDEIKKEIHQVCAKMIANLNNMAHHNSNNSRFQRNSF